MARNCPNCQQSIDENTRVCPYCSAVVPEWSGSQLSTPEVPSQTDNDSTSITEELSQPTTPAFAQDSEEKISRQESVVSDFNADLLSDVSHTTPQIKAKPFSDVTMDTLETNSQNDNLPEGYTDRNAESVNFNAGYTNETVKTDNVTPDEGSLTADVVSELTDKSECEPVTPKMEVNTVTNDLFVENDNPSAAVSGTKPSAETPSYEFVDNNLGMERQPPEAPGAVRMAPQADEREYRNTNPVKPQNPTPVTPKPAVPYSNKPPEKSAKILGLGDWVLTIFLTMLPIAGFIMLIYWSVSKETDPNKQNFARAYLIIMVSAWLLSILLVVLIVFVVGLGAASSGYYY